VTTRENPVTSHRFLTSEEPTAILKIGQQLEKSSANGEFIGLAYLSSTGVAWLKEIFKTGASHPAEKPFQESPGFSKASLSDLFQELIDRGHPVGAMETYKGWIEVDTFEDYRRAWAKL